MSTKKIAVIGAGLGGLSAACLLASKGHQVTVFEKNSSPGGKINQMEAAGFRFDTGPSLLTMPDVLRDLFKQCGASLHNYLTLRPVDPICRYFYPDGTVFNCYQDRKQTIAEIKRIAPEDVRTYSSFLDYSEELFNRTKDAFLYNPLYALNDLKSLNLTDVFKIDALKTVSERVDSTFLSPYMRQFFKRFTTYNGSSPFQAPATLNVIPHVELGMGGYYVEGGMNNVIETLVRLGKSLGVTFTFESEVQSISVEHSRVQGIKIKGESELYPADLVVSNSDTYETYLNLLPQGELSYLKKKKLQNTEPSCSGFLLLLGIDRTYEQLSHHNIFFSGGYEKEFDDIFKKKKMPDDPTIYIADTSCTNPEHAVEKGSNLFILVNAPYLSDNWSWQQKSESYAEFIIDELEKRGLKGLRKSIAYRHRITPVDFYERHRSNKGSIYGTSSNSNTAAFMRPKNKAREIDGLYLAGGSTHPGGGIPLVILSAFNVVELIGRYE